MKLQTYLCVALTAHLSAAGNLPRAFPKLERRQSVASTLVTAMNYPYGKVPGGKLPTRVELPPKHPEIPGFKTVKIRYGPYKVPNMGITTRTLTGPEEGMLWNYPDMGIQKPCSDCMIVGIVPDYEDLNGKSANIDAGHWLHHIVLLNSNRQSDPTCAARAGNSLPHWVVGFSAASSERFFASGNERTTLRLHDHNITDAGYRVTKADSFAMIVDLMNMNMVDNTLYVVITYDYIDGKPAGMHEIKPVWLDVDQCGFSEARAKSQTGSYTVSSVPWRSTVDGDILVMGGHLHDGGTRLQIKADGKLICDSFAGYGENARYISGGMAHRKRDEDPKGIAKGSGKGAPKAAPKGFPKEGGAGLMAPKGVPGTPKEAGGHGHGQPGKKHISSMALCWKGRENLKTQTIRQGQVWAVEAEYDYKKFAGATHPNGQQENVMGIAILWIKKARSSA